MQCHLMGRQAALVLETKTALVTRECEISMVFPLFNDFWRYAWASHHRCAIRRLRGVHLFVLRQVIRSGKQTKAGFATPIAGICVRLAVVLEHGLTLKQALACGALVASTFLMHAEVHFIEFWANKATRTVGTLLAANRAMLQSLVSREFGYLGKLARALLTLEHLSVLATHVCHHAAPVEGHVVTLSAVFLQGLQ